MAYNDLKYSNTSFEKIGYLRIQFYFCILSIKKTHFRFNNKNVSLKDS